jgi:pimeloyl-ACP methyl ester carboxylesterase
VIPTVPEIPIVAEPTRARYPEERGFVEHGDGVNVFYEVYGSGADTICLLPPWPLTTSRVWRCQIPYLSRHFRVIAIDPRGNGRSDRPQHPAAYTRQAHVADILCVLDDTATERAMLVSLSPRAPLALALAVEHPDRVAAVAFITPQLWPLEGFVTPFKAAPKPHYDGYEKFNRRHMTEHYGDFVEWFTRTLFPHPHSTRQREEVVSHALETDGPTLVAATVGFDMYERDEALALAAQIRCPVLVTQNGGDAFWPKETSGPRAQASGGRLHVFEGLGPFVTARWPVAMNLALRTFFESARGRHATERDSRSPASFTL